MGGGTRPGELLLEEFLKPLGISQSAFAVRLGDVAAADGADWANRADYVWFGLLFNALDVFSNTWH